MRTFYLHAFRLVVVLTIVAHFNTTISTAGDYAEFSGIYPHLAAYNHEGECGVGSVVPWAGKLWYITYGPHKPFGSSDKLYEIDDKLNRIIRTESVGGTHANRMIHRESEQLFIGSYAINNDGAVRVIQPKVMPGRLTGNARHLFDPINKIYFATMEEGFYEVDVHSLEVKTINPDGNTMKNTNGAGPLLPGCHGKGLYSSQGRLVYANNGERSADALIHHDITSGCLAEWDGKDWNVVLRNQFTEVTGPGGIYGNDNVNDPIWSVGWDHRSVILMLLDDGKWSKYRLPKASHTYDGAHGWHTEWPRIRDINDDYLLMTMHGMFWSFPKTFSAGNLAGICPLSSYLKIVGDFCEWNGKIVFGCDDAALSDFRTNGVFDIKGTKNGQSNSNLWFVDPHEITGFGPVIGRGGPWVDDAIKADEYSEPFLFNGFDHRNVHISHNAGKTVNFSFEIDKIGIGQWTPIDTVSVPPIGYAYHIFDQALDAQWIRVKSDQSCSKVSLVYQFNDHDARSTIADSIFDGLAKPNDSFSTGVIRPRGEDLGTLHFAASHVSANKQEETGYYEIGPDMKLQHRDDPKAHQWLKNNHSIEKPVFTVDDASVLVIDSSGRRYRLPKGHTDLQQPTLAGWPRSVREIVTERSLFNCQGTIYELPRQNSGGFTKIRPVASSDYMIMDLCSWRGMLVIAGIADNADDNPHIIKSDDDKCALWFGTIDDLWKLGKPRGEGGPWKNATVKSGESSDPYLMTGYDKKQLTLSHKSKSTISIKVEVDITGEGHWVCCKELKVKPGENKVYTFPEGFNAYWVRMQSSDDAIVSASLIYE